MVYPDAGLLNSYEKCVHALGIQNTENKKIYITSQNYRITEFEVN